MAAVVVPVRDDISRDRFIDFPWDVYADNDAWVPPLRADVRTLMADDHPFHEHADTEYFLAVRDGDVVGRITATAWLADRRQTEAIGPFNLSTNDELYGPGVLLNAYDTPPVLLMGHSPPYYRRLFENAGWEKARDLLSYRLEADAPPDRLVRGAKRLARRIDGLRIRQLELKRIDEEVELIKEVFNAAWQKNWGFTPLTDAEIRHLADELKPMVDERYAFMAEVHGQPVGFALALPDYNQALKYVNGRLLPFGIFKLLWYRRKIDQVRVFTLGLTPDYQGKGIDALFYLRMFQNGMDAGIHRAEAGWVLEDNWGMRRGLERMGAHVFKTYRVYGRGLG